MEMSMLPRQRFEISKCPCGIDVGVKNAGSAPVDEIEKGRSNHPHVEMASQWFEVPSNFTSRYCLEQIRDSCCEFGQM